MSRMGPVILVVAVVGVGCALLAGGAFLWARYGHYLPWWARSAVQAVEGPDFWHCGSAFILDAGSAATGGRYTVDVGGFELVPTTMRVPESQHAPRDERLKYSLCELPEEPLRVGVVVPVSDPRWWAVAKEALGESVMTIRLRDKSAGVLWTETGRLATEWDWSAPDPLGTVLWSESSFVPDADARYELEVEISPPIRPTDPVAALRLVLRRGPLDQAPR